MEQVQCPVCQQALVTIHQPLQQAEPKYVEAAGGKGAVTGTAHRMAHALLHIGVIKTPYSVIGRGFWAIVPQ